MIPGFSWCAITSRPRPSSSSNFWGAPVYSQVGTEGEDVLITRCLGGDTEAFQPLVERYYRPLFHMATRMLDNREDARDATQTAFLKAYQALASFDRDRQFFSWICRILVNDCLNLIRARRPLQPLESVADPPDEAADPVQTAELRQRVRHALLELTAEQREVVVLRHFADMSYGEAAAVLGVDQKTVKSRLYSARQRLCGLLAGERT